MTTRYTQMRNAINDVELALSGLEIDSVARLFETADDSVMVKVPLGALRQLARCYPTLNRIINDPSFDTPSPIGVDEIQDSSTLPTQMSIDAAAKYR